MPCDGDAPFVNNSNVAKAAALLAVCVLLFQANGFAGAFVYDDIPNIIHNQSIKSLAPFWKPFLPDSNAATAGRPLVNWTFALNWALSGGCAWSYHLVNIMVHLAASLTLFGLARRSFLMHSLRGRFAPNATGLGLATALIWGVHPLQTHAVTYISQRTESMMSLFFLLTCYCAVRGWQSTSTEKRGKVWHVLAAMCCLAGVGCKEVIVAAPVLVWLYDVVLRGRGWFGSLRESALLYVLLVLSLAPLALLVATGATEETGALNPERSPLQYLLVQAQVLPHYLWLMLWPADAAFDYVWGVPTLREALPGLVASGGLALAAIVGGLRRKVWSYALLWFLLILAPTSSVLPMMFPAAAYRLYLPLAGPAALVVALGWELCRRTLPQPGRVAGIALVAVVASLGAGTVLANAAFQDPLVLWQQTTERQPENPRAHHWVGSLLLERGYVEASIPHFQRALAIRPDYARARGALGRALLLTGRHEAAGESLRRALELAPNLVALHRDLALLHLAKGEHEAAVRELQALLRHNPGDESARQLLRRTQELLGGEEW